MHLHGFYFDVDSLGNGGRDTLYAAGQKPRVVTQLMSPGSTMSMTWNAERAGNWLFHCHLMVHVSPTLYVDGSPKPRDTSHAAHDASAGMSGMVMGITVRGPTATPAEHADNATPTRRITLLMQVEPNRFAGAPAYGFVLADQSAPTPSSTRVPVPGPTLVLERGQPVEITLFNKLPEATAIHWHGMELESYYDGVHGWSGAGTRVTPMIEPGGRFVVRFTPPRAGTFMYHTHLHDKVQLTSGLYGAMLVVEPGREPFGRNGSRARARPWRARDGRASRAQRRARSDVRLEGRHASSRAPHQHHPLRHPRRLAPERRRSTDVASDHQGRGTSTARTLSARARQTDNRGRRDLRLRVRHTARAWGRLD